MGKGDRKTAKGKRFNASYGNFRKQAGKAAGVGPAAAAAGKAVKTPAKKVVAKKTVAKSG